eukprot:scaffold14251_cov165-Alexandrium_tamarense.AAC.2
MLVALMHVLEGFAFPIWKETQNVWRTFKRLRRMQCTFYNGCKIRFRKAVRPGEEGLVTVVFKHWNYDWTPLDTPCVL